MFKNEDLEGKSPLFVLGCLYFFFYFSLAASPAPSPWLRSQPGGRHPELDGVEIKLSDQYELLSKVRRYLYVSHDTK